jgi:uncharacterized protein YjeT (DUF2065 family)
MLSQTVFSPLATILRDRRFGLVSIGLLGVHLGLVSLGLPGWQCPFFRLTGVPCPGCGLTRACTLLLSGHVQSSLKFHAFGFVFVLLIAILLIATLLPKSISEPLIYKAETIERRSGVTIIILTGLILYWLGRLIFYPTAFAQLIRG